MATCVCKPLAANIFQSESPSIAKKKDEERVSPAVQPYSVTPDASSKYSSSRPTSLSRSSTSSELSSHSGSSVTSYGSDQASDASNAHYEPLVSPALVKHEIVASARSTAVISNARREAANIIAGRDDRVLVVVGPCSIHNPAEALEYARLLRSRLETWPNLMIVMRSYLYVLRWIYAL